LDMESTSKIVAIPLFRRSICILTLLPFSLKIFLPGNSKIYGISFG